MLDRSVAPQASAIVRPKLPQPDELSLGNLPVTVLNQGNQPVVLFEMIVPVGWWEEPKPGLAYYLFKMLTEGTRQKSAEQIAAVFDYYGSHLEVTPTLDHVSIKLFALSGFLPELLGLMNEMLTEVSFPENEFETLRQIRQQQIRQQYARNNTFASMKFREMLFGKAHPYGIMMDEALAARISLDDLNEHKNILLSTPHIFLTGNITEEVLTTVQDRMGQLEFTSPPSRNNNPISGVRQLSITREDSTQASIRSGHLTINRDHPDTHKLKIANTLLGGFFGSRLMKNIREEKGLTYGIHSSIMHLQHASYWHISSEVLRDKTELAQEEIKKEINLLRLYAPENQEFEMVKNYIKGKFLSSFDSPFSSHEMFKMLKLSQLTSEHFNDFLETLDSMQPGEVCEMANQYFHKEMTDLKVV